MRPPQLWGPKHGIVHPGIEPADSYAGSIIIIIKNECHSNIIVDRLQGCGHSKKPWEGESE